MEYEQIIQCDKFTSSKMACSDICRKKRTTRKLLRLGISIHHIEVKIIQIQTTGYRKEEEKIFAINLAMRKCIYILWQKFMPSKKEARAISGRLWDWCKSLCFYEVNVGLTSMATEEDSEMVCSSLFIKWGPGNYLGKSHQEKLHIYKKAREILPLL